MVDPTDNVTEQNGNDGPDLLELKRLFVPAPSSTFSCFRKRAKLLQGTRLLIETQVYGYWIVFDIVLKRLFRVATVAAKQLPDNPSNHRVGDRS